MSIIILIIGLGVTIVFSGRVLQMYHKKVRSLDIILNILISERYYIEKKVDKRWEIIISILNNMEKNLKCIDNKENYKNTKNELKKIKKWIRLTNKELLLDKDIMEEQIFIQNQMIYNIKNLIVFCEDIKNKKFYNKYIKDLNSATKRIKERIETYNTYMIRYEKYAEMPYFELINKISKNKYKDIRESYIAIPEITKY